MGADQALIAALSSALPSSHLRERIDWLTIIELVQLLQQRANEPENVMRSLSGLQPKGPSIVWLAVREENVEYLGFLLARGARPALDCYMGLTPLLACGKYHGSARVAELLINHGANVDGLPDFYDFTGDFSEGCHNFMSSVGVAAINGRFELVELLLRRGADARFITRDGHSTLCQVSCAQGEAADEDELIYMARLLISFGARPSMLEQRTGLPSEYAEMAGRNRLAVFMIENEC